MKSKFLSLSLILFVGYGASAQFISPYESFDKVKFVKARYYKSMLKHGADTLSCKSVNMGKRLSAKNARILMDIVLDSTTYGAANLTITADAKQSKDFLFFDKNGKVIAQISLLLDNNFLQSSPPIHAWKMVVLYEGQLVPLKYFSEKGRKRLESFLEVNGILK